VPVAPHVGDIDRNHDDVAQTTGDVAVAARAEVGLDRLVGLDEADLEFSEGFRVLHGSAHQRPEQQESPHDEGGGDEHDVGWPLTVPALRVESHAPSIAARWILAAAVPVVESATGLRLMSRREAFRCSPRARSRASNAT